MKGRSNRLLDLIGGLTIAALVIGGASFVEQPAALATSPSYHPLTGFGGFKWFGKVTQISAQWRVPTISPSDAVEGASTWVGAQDWDGGSPFIQLGTVENIYGAHGTQYGAFWSDPNVDFHPQMLDLAVGASDLVSADMTMVHTGWSLTFDDVTRGTTKTKIIRYGAGLTYSQGEWLQEDPTSSDGITPVDMAYPSTSTVSILDLVVNHSHPTLLLKNAQVLISSNGIILVPSAVTDDSFYLSAPTGLAKQYLEAVRPTDAAVSLFSASLLTWSHDSMVKRARIVKAVAKAYAKNASAIGSLSFPGNAKPSAAELEQRLRKVQKDLLQWIPTGMAQNGTVYNRLRDDQDLAPAADKVRAAVGLPPS